MLVQDLKPQPTLWLGGGDTDAAWSRAKGRMIIAGFSGAPLLPALECSHACNLRLPHPEVIALM